MKQRIIKTLKITGIFVAGIVVGALFMNFLHMYVRPTQPLWFLRNVSASVGYLTR